ncbi:probable inactive receptor kinase At1g27190 [Magnolia sinica]|uniref:probable inactive receptor kinase At1g27190 n=1 Tax=Magnolia sinica TaxID=86752 RepID=UPI00265A2B5B|nr:probable inactive receptor kinase At1g27190 [Magnolia sinica]XP_058080182.1 probable inactive receptor kinase At1g27190 [Magnolia sinica]XP_058080183.1 probable inactive receptor kinase At1g27190 [Magnolia sinica]
MRRGGNKRNNKKLMQEHHHLCFSFYTLIFLLNIILSYTAAPAAAATVVEDDVRCLKGIKANLTDPQNRLDWNFDNNTVGFICQFVGATCWNERENRLIDLRLPSMSLGGHIPEPLQYCRSITTLDLSDNSLTGTIPPRICDWLPYLVVLDLSSNDLSGPIPPDLVNCTFLNTLRLDSNRLSGTIPYQLSRLPRLKRLSVSNNQLSGSIPPFLSNFDPNDFLGNDGLCGRPLGSKCGGLRKTSLVIIIAAGIFGAVVSLVLGFGLWWWCFVRSSRDKKRRRRGAANESDYSWVERLRSHRFVQVSLFQKPLVKIKLADLMAATNGFDPDNIIASNRMGTTYRAVLADGSALAIKRLHAGCKLSEKQFCSEMNKLGQQLRHPNLVPLLGYCIAGDEKLLVYKHMPNGTLSSLLYVNSQPLDWPTRLKIGIGAARGLAWLHHGFQPPYLHENMSSNVIVLDEDYEARITDFGLARLMSSADSEGSTLINGDFGDFGYVAPEYSSTLVASLKGDSYGFGVVLLELATGQKPLDISSSAEEEGFKGNLVDWVNQLSSAGRIKDTIDKSLCGKGHDDEILEFLRVACGCVVSRPKDRSSMYQVYESLRSIGDSHDFSEQFDEFPLVYGKPDPDRQE